jgi:HAD superfamily hydrolase (TIGR01509 family)
MSAHATLFDFDGVLVDSEPSHLAAFNDVLARFGIAIDEREYIERWLGFDDAGVFRGVLADRGRAPTDAEVRALIDAKNPRFMERLATDMRVFDGAADLVRRRAARGVVGIVSGALEREIDFALKKMAVRDAVAFIVSAEHTTACKPDPEGYVLGLAELRARGHADAARVVVIEDSVSGVEAAKRAGLRCVAVATSYTNAELEAAGADAIARDLLAIDDAMLDGR